MLVYQWHHKSDKFSTSEKIYLVRTSSCRNNNNYYWHFWSGQLYCQSPTIALFIPLHSPFTAVYKLYHVFIEALVVGSVVCLDGNGNPTCHPARLQYVGPAPQTTQPPGPLLGGLVTSGLNISFVPQINSATHSPPPNTYFTEFFKSL